METSLVIIGVEVGTLIEIISVVDLGKLMETSLGIVGVERMLMKSTIILSQIPNRYKMN